MEQSLIESFLIKNGNAIITGIMTILSGISIFFITNYFNQKNENKKFHRQKLEDAFRLSNQIYQNLVIRPSEIINPNIKTISKDNGNSGELYMIISFYAPKVLATQNEFMESYKNIALFINKWLIEKDTVEKEEFSKNMDDFTKSLHKLQKKLQTEIKRYV
ncbi:hypothetical protein [Sulfurimonas sp.]